MIDISETLGTDKNTIKGPTFIQQKELGKVQTARS